MPLILQSASFELGWQGKRGRILFSDGNHSQFFPSKVDAVRGALEARDKGLMIQLEVEVVVQQILSSSLPDASDFVDEVCLRLALGSYGDELGRSGVFRV